MSNSGWIKLHRQITDNWIWQDAERLRAWIDILLMVNHEDKKTLVNGQLLTIHRGERLTSITKLAIRWGWSRQRVRTFLDLLEQDGMCTSNRTTNGTTLKVSNYAEYQDFQTPNRTANVTADVTADLTADITADVTQTIINKNDKNDKEFLSGASAQKKIPPSRDDIESYCNEKGYHIDIDEFMSYYTLNNWTLSGGRKITDWTAAVDYWNSKSQKIEKSNSDLTETMPMYQEFKDTPMQLGTDPKFEGGVVAEMIRRKRKKNA